MNDKKLLNPFPGLRPFEEEEDVLFFGREKQIDELLRKLRTSRFLAIIGSSGSGKSSLVKSGLLPSLHSGLMSGVGSQWRIALFRPGNDPMGQLNEALVKNGVLRDNQTEEEFETNRAINETILRRSNLGLIESYKQSGLDKKNNLLVLVDQFEELFRFSRYEKDAGEGRRDSVAFINLLLKAAEQKEFPIYVVFTMRSDFLGECTEFRGLPEAINEGQYLVPRMTREERREAITGPIAVAHGAITPALVNRLLNDVGDNPDQLPIMQHALMRTWDEWTEKGRTDQPIDIADYEAIGTISEALSQHAEEAYAELTTDRERQICETIFKELTDKGGLSNGIRRPRLVSELAATAGASEEEVIKVIEVFRKPGRGFLMPAYPTALKHNTIVDISHESIMRVWKRLMTWLEEEEEAAQVYLHLCEAVTLYESGKGGLWRDPELQIAIKWKDEQNKNAAWASRYNNFFDKVIFFLEHSRQQRDLEVKHKEELQKQRLRITRRVTIVVSVIALVAVILAIYSVQKKAEATVAQTKAMREAQNALDQKRMADSTAQVATTLRVLAEAASKKAKESADTALMAKADALTQKAWALEESAKAQKERAKAEYNAAVAEQNKQDAIAKSIIADTASARAKRSEEAAIEAQKDALDQQKKAESKNIAHKAIMFMNNGELDSCKRLALQAYENNQASGGDFQDNDIYQALYLTWQNTHNRKNIFNYPGAPVRTIAGMPHADIVFCGDEDGQIVTAANEGGVLVWKAEKNLEGEVRSLSVDKDGNYLLAVLLNHAVLYKIGSDYSLKEAATVKFSGNGKRGAFLGDKFFVQSTTGVKRFEIGNTASADSINIPNCSSFVVTGSGKVFISSFKNIYEYNTWNALASPANTFKLSSPITSLSTDATGRYLAAGTYQGSIWLKDFTGGNEKSFPGIHKSPVNDVKFGQIGGGRLQLASASSDKTIRLIEVEDGALKTKTLVALADHAKWVYALCYSRDGNYVFSGGEDQVVVGRPTTMSFMYNALFKK